MNRTYLKRTRMVYPQRQDEFVATQKYSEPAMCVECGNIFEHGRWTNNKTYPTADVYQTRCPACQRKDGHRPAGEVKLKGPFVQQHHDEILGRVRRIERKERATHPVEQIMSITGEPEYTNIATSGIHLARRIGDALRHSYKGELAYSYGKGEKSIQVTWER